MFSTPPNSAVRPRRRQAAARMPMSPASAGMLGRENGGSDKDKVTHARIVVDRERQQV